MKLYAKTDKPFYWKFFPISYTKRTNNKCKILETIIDDFKTPFLDSLLVVMITQLDASICNYNWIQYFCRYSEVPNNLPFIIDAWYILSFISDIALFCLKLAPYNFLISSNHQRSNNAKLKRICVITNLLCLPLLNVSQECAFW